MYYINSWGNMIDTCKLHDDLEDFAQYLGVDYDDYYELIYNLPDEDEDIQIGLTDWLWECVCPKSYTSFTSLCFFIMSTELMIAALRRGQTGSEILSILDAITNSDDTNVTESVVAEPTSEWIEFW